MINFHNLIQMLKSQSQEDWVLALGILIQNEDDVDHLGYATAKTLLLALNNVCSKFEKIPTEEECKKWNELYQTKRLGNEYTYAGFNVNGISKPMLQLASLFHNPKSWFGSHKSKHFQMYHKMKINDKIRILIDKIQPVIFL